MTLTGSRDPYGAMETLPVRSSESSPNPYLVIGACNLTPNLTLLVLPTPVLSQSNRTLGQEGRDLSPVNTHLTEGNGSRSLSPPRTFGEPYQYASPQLVPLGA